MIAQYLLNTALAWTDLTLVACAFFLATRGSRHFAVGIGSAVVAGPYLALALRARLDSALASILSGLALCILLGLTFQVTLRTVRERGARPEQLLLFSLAVTIVVENLALAVFGARSRVAEFLPSALPVLGSNLDARKLVIGGAAVTALTLMWHTSLLGKVYRAADDSPVALSLRGYRVERVQASLSAVGFAFAGAGGLSLLVDTGLRPSSGMDATIQAAVVCLAAPFLADGLIGVCLAAAAVAAVRSGLVLLLAGDWSATPALLVLAMAKLTSVILDSIRRD